MITSIKPALKKPLGITILAVTILVILFSGASGITAEQVTGLLNRFDRFIARSAQENNREAKFSFDSIEILGWGYNKYAVVNKVSLALSQKMLLDTTRWSFSTDKMLVMPHPSGRLVFVFPEPVNVIKNSQLKTIVTFPSPAKYAYYEGWDHRKPISIHTFLLPGQMTFTSANTADTSNYTHHDIVISFDPLPLVEVTLRPEDNVRDIAYLFSNVKLETEEGVYTKIESFSGKYHEQFDVNNHLEGSYHWEIANFSFHDHQAATAPYNLTANIFYRGDQPNMDINLLLPDMGKNAELIVDNVLLTGGEFLINATGRLLAIENDTLPIGSLDIEIKHPNKLITSDLLPDSIRSVTKTALHKISGTNLEGQSDIKINIRRDPGGMTAIGNSNLEELMALVLKDALQPASVPKLPPAEPASPAPPAALSIGGS